MLAYAEHGAGDGRPVVFLHGFPGSPRRGVRRRRGAPAAIARRAPRLSGRALVPIGLLGRHAPRSFLRLCRSQLAAPDREALERPDVTSVFVRDFLEGLRQGGGCVGAQLDVLMRPWPFAPTDVAAPVRFLHGENRAGDVLAGRP